MTEYTIQDWTIDGDEAHAHVRGTDPDGTTYATTISRAHDAPGWTIEGRDGELYDTPTHALIELEKETHVAHESLDDLNDGDDDAVTVLENTSKDTEQSHTLFQGTLDQMHIFPSRWDARTANRLIKYFYPNQYTEIDKRRDREWFIQLTPIMPAGELSTVKYLSTLDLEELQRRNDAELASKHDSTMVVKEPPRPYGGQYPFLTLTLKNETTGDEWTHPIGQQDASALSEWLTDQSEYQRQDLPYELEELASRIVSSYAESENNPDPRPIRPATIDEVRAYLIAQTGILNVEADGPNVLCTRLSDSRRDALHWIHSRLEDWTITTEGGHTWLRGPNGLGSITTNTPPNSREELCPNHHGIDPK